MSAICIANEEEILQLSSKGKVIVNHRKEEQQFFFLLGEGLNQIYCLLKE